MAWGVIILRVFDIHMPPALAIALIPMVIDHPTWKYPVSVAFGTSLLTATFLLHRLEIRSKKGSGQDGEEQKTVSLSPMRSI